MFMLPSPLPPSRPAAPSRPALRNPPLPLGGRGGPPPAGELPLDKSTEKRTIPRALIEAIISGRCVAFVGSGFSGSAELPTWVKMLSNIVDISSAKAAAAPAEPSKNESLARFFGHLRKKLLTPSGEVLDQVAQMLEDTIGTVELERLVAELLRPKSVKESMCTRLKLLDEIPFRAILTTNYDELLTGSTPLDPRVEHWPEYFEVLRGSGVSKDIIHQSKEAPEEPLDKYASLANITETKWSDLKLYGLRSIETKDKEAGPGPGARGRNTY